MLCALLNRERESEREGKKMWEIEGSQSEEAVKALAGTIIDSPCFDNVNWQFGNAYTLMPIKSAPQWNQKFVGHFTRCSSLWPAALWLWLRHHYGKSLPQNLLCHLHRVYVCVCVLLIELTASPWGQLSTRDNWILIIEYIYIYSICIFDISHAQFCITNLLSSNPQTQFAPNALRSVCSGFSRFPGRRGMKKKIDMESVLKNSCDICQFYLWSRSVYILL